MRRSDRGGHTNLIKVVKAQASRYGIEKNGIVHRQGDDIGDIKLKEIDIGKDGLDGGVADQDQDEEDDGKEIRENAKIHGVAPCVGHREGGREKRKENKIKGRIKVI
jgi:hypothetical protein